MTTEPTPHEQLTDPQRVTGPDGTRADGRPTSADPLADAPKADSVPTVAPEEEGGTPTTEHAPGADL